jgi:hypothetical protein
VPIREKVTKHPSLRPPCFVGYGQEELDEPVLARALVWRIALRFASGLFRPFRWIGYRNPLSPFPEALVVGENQNDPRNLIIVKDGQSFLPR